MFGTSDAPPPATPELHVQRAADEREATVSITPVPGALGYNIRWGVAPDRLFLTYQIYDDELADIDERVQVRALNTGVDYWFAVEAFSPGGVSALSEVAAVPAAD